MNILHGILLPAVLAIVSVVAYGADGFVRTKNGVLFRGVEIHNVASLVPTNGMYRFCRVDSRTFEALKGRSRDRSFTTTGVELRFKIREGEAKLVIGGLDEGVRTSCRIYFGDFISDDPMSNMVIDGTNTVLSFQKNSVAHLVERSKKYGCRYHPEVVRVVLSSCSRIGIRDVIGAVEPPPPEMLPRRTYLAYGSSITHGSIALLIERSYPALVAEALGADVRNLGLAGSARMEKEVADFISSEDFDYVSLEMGVNVLRSMSVAEYEQRVRYIVKKVAQSHPKARVLAIDVFRAELSGKEQETASVFRKTLERVVEELSLPNVVYVNGLHALSEKDTLSSGVVHPSSQGHEEIARFLISKFM